ncbi:hypothetical protein OHA84_37450 (plasmid) [Streptomyces sp. NBC_00513]|uniref:preATP grasp domain-containing protein n=1 Tax=unclassified Streptomyces TaxID=2593676 RepID=UPI0022574568|nr:hypothetical protein [Streptomyces sp. NBC_00424]MCX5078863.1 hypothetical protein [Streptomyces sp. NBC_00424]WUD46217.1 hypothetical protein OHA84_37450 [Streptomyces sp. NBC_00513]
MRILIGNHIDPSIRARTDMRAWTQRLTWFARPGDVLILCTEPDPAFLDYALTLTGTGPGEVTVLTAPPGRYNGMLLDPEALTDPAFLDQVRAALRPAGGPQAVGEIFALWPSASVARFATALGLADRMPGLAYFAQGGAEIGNNKANFRAIAAAAGVPTVPGEVCRSRQEAVAATHRLLAQAEAVVVQQAHNGAGVGNQILLAPDSRLVTDHVGARHLHRLDPGPAGVTAYWQQRWDWASADGRHPVVVAAFAPGAEAVYSEHFTDDSGTCPTEQGRLHYVGRRLSHQTVPLQGLNPLVHARLVDNGARLAEAYRSLGYRGHLSADAITTPDGRVYFTEVNAQVSGSLHIYQVIAHRIVGTADHPARAVVEYHVPPTWHVPDADAFHQALADLDLAWDPASRTGVIVSMPIAPGPDGAQFVFCLAYDPATGHEAPFALLDARFATRPAAAFDPADHVGIPVTAFSS